MAHNQFTETEIKTLKQLCILFNDDKISKRYNLKSLVKYKKDFSDREIKIIQLICSEYTTIEIADKLGYSNRTIEGIRLSLIESTNSKSSIGLVKYAIKHGIYILK